MLSKEDVLQVAKSINVTLTDEQITEVLKIYPAEQEQDPTGTWNLVIENCIYQIIN